MDGALFLPVELYGAFADGGCCGECFWCRVCCTARGFYGGELCGESAFCRAVDAALSVNDADEVLEAELEDAVAVRVLCLACGLEYSVSAEEAFAAFAATDLVFCACREG